MPDANSPKSQPPQAGVPTPDMEAASSPIPPLEPPLKKHPLSKSKPQEVPPSPKPDEAGVSHVDADDLFHAPAPIQSQRPPVPPLNPDMPAAQAPGDTDGLPKGGADAPLETETSHSANSGSGSAPPIFDRFSQERHLRRFHEKQREREFADKERERVEKEEREREEQEERERREREAEEHASLEKEDEDEDDEKQGLWETVSGYVKKNKWTWAAGALSLLGGGYFALSGDKSKDSPRSITAGTQEQSSISKYKTIGAAAGVIGAAAGAWCARDKIAACFGKSESSDVSKEPSEPRQKRKSGSKFKKKSRAPRQKKSWFEQYKILIITISCVAIGLLAISFCLLCRREEAPEPLELEGEDLV